ncbi:MAG: hypothetical protein R3264_18510, partial [Anaerolineae bacterium]|nr:hypothetical protein [Anaerolineae bacterium]
EADSLPLAGGGLEGVEGPISTAARPDRGDFSPLNPPAGGTFKKPTPKNPVGGIEGGLSNLPTFHPSILPPFQSLFTGLLIGLATLSHVYGAFWLPALILGLFWLTGRRSLKPALVMSLGFGLALLPWLIFVASGWQDFLSQSRNYANRFGLLDYRFYLTNLLQEVERYDPILNGAKLSFGSWLWLIACLLSLGWLVSRAVSGEHAAWTPGWLSRLPPDREKLSAQLLLTVLGTIGGLFALLLSFKTFSYLATLWPILALVIAAGVGRMWQISPARPWWRPALVGLFVLAMLEGAVVSAALKLQARQTTPYQTYTLAIATELPPNQKVMGLQHYWLGLAQSTADYRSILVPIFWTSRQYVPQPHSFAQAANAIPPDIVLLDQIMLDFLAESADPGHELNGLNQQIINYLASPHATLIGEINDPTYGRTQIYQLTPKVTNTGPVESDTR